MKFHPIKMQILHKVKGNSSSILGNPLSDSVQQKMRSLTSIPARGTVFIHCEYLVLIFVSEVKLNIPIEPKV